MAETFTMNETPAEPEILNSDEQDSLRVAESLEAGEQPLLAGKYKSTSDLEKAYVELQQRLGEGQVEEETPEPEEQGEEPEAEEEEASDEAGDMTQEQAEILMESIGGEEEYNRMLKWAGSNFSKDEIEMYDSVMESNVPQAIFFAVQALAARYQDGVGSDGELLTGRDAANTNDSFKSQAELVAAMSDPRYDRDPAYRSDVMRRLENSDVEF
jgi:hypothetical protein